MCRGLHGCISPLACGLAAFVSDDLPEFRSKYFLFLSGEPAGCINRHSLDLAPCAMEASHLVQGLFHGSLHAGLFGMGVVGLLGPPVRGVRVPVVLRRVYGQ